MTSNPGLLRIGLFNTRSVRTKLHHISEILNEFDLDILCLTETWLFPSDIDIVGAALPESHSMAHVPRTTTTGAPGGGVALIYSLAISNIKHGMAAFQASSFELMGASFSCHRQTINIYIVYRPGHPGTDRAFMEEFGSFLDGLLLVRGNSIICGDFNYWVDDPSSKPFSAEFVELLDLSNFENFVSFPTHLSGHTLDLILAPAGSEYVKHVEALPIDSNMSDHALILFCLEVMRPHAVKKTITFRSYRNVNNNSIVNDIEHILNILDVSSLTAEDCAIWYNNFFYSLEKKFCPLISKEILVKADAPWYDHTVAV